MMINKQQKEEVIREFQSLFCMQTIIPDIQSQNEITEWLDKALDQTYQQGVADGKAETLQLLTDEIAVAHKEGTPTSRLTSLYIKITSRNNNQGE